MTVNTQKRGTYLPLEQRIQAYNEVLRLRKQGLSFNDIVKEIHRLQGVKIAQRQVVRWVGGHNTPFGKINKFDEKPTPELAYIIGAMSSDAYQSLQNYNYGLWLRVTDYEFACEFGRCLAKVLGKEKPYEPHWRQSEQRWVVLGLSILLFKHLGKSWQELKCDIEAGRICVASFLRGFYDGEGSNDGIHLTVHNTDREKLIYVQQLLRRYFGIKATGPHLGQGPGHHFRDPRNGKIYQTKKQCYYLYIPARYQERFLGEIGFTIRRKQLGRKQ